MTDLARALAAEALRLRRTLAMTVTLAAPLFVGLIAFLIGMNRRGELVPSDEGWRQIYETIWPLWALMMLPLVITATTALIGQIEHQSVALKQLFATPTPRWAIYAAKLIAAAALAGLSSLVAVLAVWLAGLGLRLLASDTHPIPALLPVADVAELAVRPWAAALLLVALHLWIAMRFRSFAVAVSIGIFGTFSGLAFIGAEEGFWWPWLLPIYALPEVRPNDQTMFHLPPMLLGSIGFILLGALGCWRVVRRDVAA